MNSYEYDYKKLSFFHIVKSCSKTKLSFFETKLIKKIVELRIAVPKDLVFQEIAYFSKAQPPKFNMFMTGKLSFKLFEDFF